ncbi:MAG TPA: OPT/YSL family transporter [Candidatus Thalassarchaeaceae archaeon]|jgi:uncharacterized oligopeptide transporter (OPT) family protein|nr:OPT/YSL family transporter [Candidatus Thalassarchaeaceae archaeon]HJM67373.1 OPT/YSL family transporter [Candidatus Thalassarchaeaceae archaeon]
MSGVRKSAYRQPVTAKGLAAIEAGTLTWLDEDMYNNLNTGLLEQYFEEKNLEESFEISHWSLSKIMIGILIGSVFSGVTAYIGLKIGLAVSAAWYVAYLLGMALKWSPSEVNISTSATTGATHASTGFIFTFPAIFLLSSEFKTEYHVNGAPLLSGIDVFQLAFIGIVASMFAGFLGVMYFIIFRRVWLVEDPLPMPGFEATLKMLDIAADVNSGAAEAAKESLQTVGLWTVLTMGFMFIIDYPLFWKEHLTIADKIAVTASGDEWGLASVYSERWIHQPSELVNGHAQANGITFFDESNPFSYTFLGVELSPTLFAVGWFMRMRTAFLVNLGSFVAWFFLIPMAVWFNVPVFTGIDGLSGAPVYTPLQEIGGPVQWIAYKSIIRTLAIGAILGGGILGLLKMAPTFISIFGDIGKAFGGEKGQEYIEGKGWYEWPLHHIPLFMILSFFAMILIFWMGGFPIAAALVFALVLILTTFLLGAIAVRVMGETGIEPVSGTSFIVLLMLLGLFLGYGDFFGLAKEEAILIALVGTTVFGSAISMSGTVVADYKNSLYIGNRPYHISKGNIMGVVPGAILGAGMAIFLSDLLANGKIDLLAPQANAFAGFTVMLAEGQGSMLTLGLGFLLGAFIEWVTGMGTAFGLGMYLPTPYTFPMMIGGAGRDWWQANRLEPVVDQIREQEGSAKAESRSALILLTTFMIAAGALTGEAFFGVESAILAVIDELSIAEALGNSYWIARLVGFTIINIIIFGGIYWLFKRAGIFGRTAVES